MRNKKIIICVAVKNESKNLKNFFKILNRFILKFDDYFIIFVESDSKDETNTILDNYLKGKKGKIINLNIDRNFNRIKSLEICRNEYLKYINENNILQNFDYMFVMDADGVNNKISYNKILNSLNTKIDWSAIFANQSLLYYDIYALRIHNLITENYVTKIINDDVSKKFKTLKKNFSENLLRFFFITKNTNERYVKVNSAFGGFAIYKIDRILKIKYDSENGLNCEHVKFNENLNEKYGGLMIDKQLTNSNGINKHTIAGILASKINYFSKRFFSNLKKV